MSGVVDRSALGGASAGALDGPALSIVGLPSELDASGAESIDLFEDVAIVGAAADAQVTATITVSDPTVATLDIPLFDALQQYNGVFGYGYTLTSDGVYGVFQVFGTEDAVTDALQQMFLDPVASDRTGSVVDPVTVSVTDGSTETDATVQLQVGAYSGHPAYSSNTGNDLTGTVFAVGDDPSRVALLQLADNTNNKVVFGGAGRMSLAAGNTTVVLNGQNQYGTATIVSQGGNTVWAGGAPIEYVAGGSSRFIMGNGGGSGYVHVDGGPAGATDEFDVWGDSRQYQSILVYGSSRSVVFAGGSNLFFGGGNAVIVANGAGQTGSLTVDGLGGNTIWAGTSALSYYEDGGSDQILLTGAASTEIYGAPVASGGVTTVQDLGNSGQFIDIGGAQTQHLFLGGGQNTVFGGAGQQVVTMNGSGTLTVADGAGTTGTQSITIGDSATGSFAFWGGGETAAITLGGGTSFVQAGSGNTSLTGGSGGASIDLSRSVSALLTVDGATDGSIDVFGFSPAHGSATISDVSGSAISSGNLVVALGDGATVTFHGVTDQGHSGILFT